MTTSSTIQSTHSGFTFNFPSTKTSREGVEYAPETVFAFTGKELDAETGYSYFGARYYAPATLAAWLSVDPMADKYPGISPYAYCAWNPLKLVDPDGRAIDSASVTQNIKNMIDPNHECYNAEFAAVYREIDDDKSTTYRFNQWDSFHENGFGTLTSGGVSLSDDKILEIGYTWGLETEINGENAPERALCEEIRHAKQFCDGEFGFYRSSSSSHWFICGTADEKEAHEWAARVSGSTSEFNLSHYQSNTTKKSAQDAWANDYPAKRLGTTPKYNNDGLYSNNYWFFKRPK